jgi:carbonic anhydrase/acetyltransferase-like protein (isoleucine patch superfamily)
MIPQKYRIITEGRYKGRIVALRDIRRAGIDKGEIGGFVDDYHNLSQDGGCWVGVEARIMGNAKVSGNALVYGFAQVYGNAMICEDAEIFGDAEIYGNAIVRGNALITDAAKVGGYTVIFDGYWRSGSFEGCEILCNFGT